MTYIPEEGEDAITRDGRRVTNVSIDDDPSIPWPVEGIVDGRFTQWTATGGWDLGSDGRDESPTDLVGPWVEPAGAFDPATAPGHTDLMVPPETLDAFLEANPLPVEIPPYGFVEAGAIALKNLTHPYANWDLDRPECHAWLEQSRAVVAAVYPLIRRQVEAEMLERAAIPLPAHVIRLVIATREVAYTDLPSPEEKRELDKALEAFAELVPWDDEPVADHEAGNLIDKETGDV